MGQSSSKKINAQDNAILSMKNQRDQLQRYQKKIVVVTARETEVARECLRRGDKKKALVALRRKKYQESLLTKTDAQLEQLEILVNDVEFARVQKDVLYGLQQGTLVLKQIHKEMGGVEGVEKLLTESEEARSYQKVSQLENGTRYISLTFMCLQEVNELLAGQMSNQDEDEVEDELEALSREVNGIQDTTQALSDHEISLPQPPSTEPIKLESQKERWERRAQEQRLQNAEEPMLA